MSEELRIKELISRYVDGEVTPEEKKMVEKYIKESPEYHAYYQKLKKLDHVLNQNTFEGTSPDWENQIQSSLLKDEKALTDQQKKRNSLFKMGVGGVLVTIMTLITFSTYTIHLDKFVSLQDTLVYAQDEFEAGSLSGLRVITLNSKDSKPIENAEVTIAIRKLNTKREQVVYKGKASSHGSHEIQFRMPDYEDGDYELIIKTDSKYGHDKIIKSIKIRKLSKILLTTDKPLYQPGQSIHIRALALKSSDSTPIKGQEVTLEIEDPKGNKVFKKKIETSVYGIIGTTFTLAHEINMGRYTIRATMGDYSAEKKVEVKKYVLPKFKVAFETDKTYYLPNQLLKGEVHANYFFGKPANRARVKIEVRTYEVDMQLLEVINGVTDEEGFFDFSYQLPYQFVGVPLEKGSSRLFFDISVTDQAQHTENITHSVPIAQNSIDIELIPESGDLVPGVENIIYVVTSYPDGKPAPSTVNVKGQNIQTNQFGIAEIKVDGIPFPPRYGSTTYQISATASDRQGNQGSVFEQLPISSNTNVSQSDSVLLRTDRSVLDVGDTLTLQILSSQAQGTVYLDVINNKQTILTKALDIENHIAQLELDLDETMTGALELHAYKILRDSNMARDIKTIFVNHKNDLQLDITSNRDTYVPGEAAQITFSTSKNQRGIPSAIGVNIVDESVFALQEKEPGFERLYFAFEKEIMNPKVTVYGLTLPELISDKPIVMDERIRAQAGNILMADVPEQDRFPIQYSSRQDNLNQIKSQKDKYFNLLFRIIFYILLLIPLCVLILTFVNYRDDKIMLLKDIGVSFLVLLGAILFLSFVLFLGYWGMVSMSIKFQSIIIWIILGAVAVGYIASFITLTRHAQRNNSGLLWINILGLSYVLLMLTGIAIIAVGQLNPPNIEAIFITVLITNFVFAIIYAHYSLGFIKVKSRLAYLSLVMALIYSQVFALIPLQLFAQREIQARIRDAADYFGGGINRWTTAVDDLGDQFDPRIVQYEPYYLTTDYNASESARRRIGFQRFTYKQGLTTPTQKERPRVRRFFPETLYSNPQVITDERGKATIDIDVADSITSWRITALANSLNGNIGSSNLAMLVFQDFFVDIDLPVALTQEDEVSIPIAVYNYLKTPQTVSLELQPEGWFEILDVPKKSVNIAANGVDVVYFRIKAKRIGKYNLTVLAYGNEKSDAISRKIEIVPDGKEMRVSTSDMLDKDVEKIITIPESAIDNSEKLFVKIYPGIFSQVVEGLDSMLRMPAGCFEQTSSTTYPNILALDYMKSTKQITPEIQMKAEQFISAGYQKLLTFEPVRGGFSIFGNNPAEKIVTAYGLMEFTDMSNVYTIDDRLIPRIQEWLLSQMEDDHWTPDGHYGAAYKARNSNVGATSYITWALLNSGLSPNDHRIKRALDYIEREYKTENDNPYTLALAALSLTQGKRNAKVILNRLNQLAKKDKDMMYWESPNNSGHGYYINRVTITNLADVETTAMVALAYIEANYRFYFLTNVVKFLISRKDSYGNWGNTQATVLSMKVLLDSLARSAKGVNARINIFVDNEKVQEIVMNEENNDVLQLIDLKPYAKKGSTNIHIQFEGKGGLLYQIVSSYFVKWNEYRIIDAGKKGFGIHIDLNYNKTELKINDIVRANVNVNYSGDGVINYAMIDLGIPPGFQVLTEDLTKYVANEVIEKYEMTGRQLVIYLKNLDKRGVHLNYRLKAKFPIKGKTPKSSAYDYYNPNVMDEVEPVEMNVLE